MKICLTLYAVAAIIVGACAQSNGHHHVVHHDTLHEATDAAFTQLDVNNNQLLEEPEYENAFSVMDTDGDGSVSLTEYQTVAFNVTGQYTNALFNFYDQNNSGVIELSSIYSEWRQIDQNGDNHVTRHEFDHFYEKLLNEIINHHGHHIIDGR